MADRTEECCSLDRPHYNEAPPDDGKSHWLRATVHRVNSDGHYEFRLNDLGPNPDGTT